ncbi:hypothetical protein ROA7450_02565 [Roseovarius albus]|uniref:HNH endonuclease 5 domain-containing protein n=1 Tax=Roseovarius albus TaxID=1247867 RepID=A0A1X6ZGX5_9RHOB|nr:HNH endonuclease [Roseovarius albus]SLN51280.1 hypothetical protein ROA7450_02565 [Roseovarius albus]
MNNEILWQDKRCIVCLSEESLTVEHIIPKSIGGVLTCRFLCKACNSRFGSGFEATAKLAPELRIAALKHGSVLAELQNNLEVGATYEQSFGNIKRSVKVRKSGGLPTSSLDDNSLIVPQNEAEGILRSMLNKRGVTECDLGESIDRWKDGPINQIIELSAGIVVRKWQEHPAKPSFSESAISTLLSLKIAYEFAAIICGSAIYAKEEGLQNVRKILIEQDEEQAANIVQRYSADRAEAIHGIAFMGNKPSAQFQIRLFGHLAFVVTMPNFGIVTDETVYTLDLKNGDHFLTR